MFKTHMMVSMVAVSALVLAGTASALEGSFTSTTGTTISFEEGGKLSVSAGGNSFSESWSTDGNSLTINAIDEASPCKGVSGSYTVTEAETGVSFSLIEDGCEMRSSDMTSGEWVRSKD